MGEGCELEVEEVGDLRVFEARGLRQRRPDRREIGDKGLCEVLKRGVTDVITDDKEEE